MPIIEGFGKQVEDTARGEREKNEPGGPSLDVILADDESSRRFAMFLQKEGDEGRMLALKVGAKALGPEEFDALAEKRKGFLEIEEKAQGMRERLTANMDRIIQSSPELKNIAAVVGTEGIKRSFLDRIEEIAINEPERFADLEQKFAGLSAAEQSIAVGNERLALLAEEYGFTEDEYGAALKKREAGDPYAIEDLLKSKMGKLKRAMTSYDEIMSMEKELDTRDSIKERLALVNENFSEIGGSLRTTLFKDEKAKELLIATLHKEKDPPSAASFQEMKKIANQERDYDAMKSEWESYKSEHESDEGYSEPAARKRFADGYAAKMAPKEKVFGFWAMIFRALFSAEIQRKLN